MDRLHHWSGVQECLKFLACTKGDATDVFDLRSGIDNSHLVGANAFVASQYVPTLLELWNAILNNEGSRLEYADHHHNLSEGRPENTAAP